MPVGTALADGRDAAFLYASGDLEIRARRGPFVTSDTAADAGPAEARDLNPCGNPQIGRSTLRRGWAPPLRTTADPGSTPVVVPSTRVG
jgi:hypothetical protein